MPVVGTKAAASAQGFGEFAQASTTATYIEDVFSTWLYTGTATNQNIVNGIDLSTYGGLVWEKNRSAVGLSILEDTARGVSGGYISTVTQSPQSGGPAFVQSFNNNGFTVNIGGTDQYVSWTFRKQPKFFDIVTYTGDGTGLSRQIAHSLGTAPGCIIIKATNATQNWKVYHRSLGNNFLMELNTNDAATNQGTQVWSSQATYFSTLSYNTSGTTYVAYLFAHNAGGFGLTGTDNVISCNSLVTGSGVPTDVNLGYEPQWLLIKKSSGGGTSWLMFDNMRGVYVNNTAPLLQANSQAAENGGTNALSFNATGFTIPSGASWFDSSSTYIYIAIRRGPMKTPTSGTTVYAGQATAAATNGTPSTNRFTAGFPIDLLIQGYRAGGSAAAQLVVDRLRGDAGRFATTSFNAETGYSSLQFSSQTGVWQPASNPADTTYCAWMFRRAPSVFDEVCWTGNGTGVRVYHNLGVAPELIILKSRSQATNWIVRPPGTPNNYMLLNSTTAVAAGSGNYINNPTATYFDTGDNASVNTNAATYVAYLFASCPGVSKVGTYDGSSSDVTVNCGFASGARFVMIRRIYYNGTTPDTGNWWVFDTARGITTSSDPALLFNSTASESALAGDYIAPASAGFIAKAGNPETNQANQTYLYLAIA